MNNISKNSSITNPTAIQMEALSATANPMENKLSWVGVDKINFLNSLSYSPIKIFTTMSRTSNKTVEIAEVKEAQQVANEEHRLTPAEAMMEERHQLQFLTRKLREEHPVAEGQNKPAANALLRAYYSELFQEEGLRTRAEWEKMGYTIRKKQGRHPAWGQPVTRTNAEGKEYQFFPVTHFYAPAAVAQA